MVDLLFDFFCLLVVKRGNIDFDSLEIFVSEMKNKNRLLRIEQKVHFNKALNIQEKKLLKCN